MPRPIITFWNGQLFRRQLNAVLDWLEANGGGGGAPPVSGSGGELDMGDRITGASFYDGGARV